MNRGTHPIDLHLTQIPVSWIWRKPPCCMQLGCLSNQPLWQVRVCMDPRVPERTFFDYRWFAGSAARSWRSGVTAPSNHQTRARDLTVSHLWPLAKVSTLTPGVRGNTSTPSTRWAKGRTSPCTTLMASTLSSYTGWWVYCLYLTGVKVIHGGRSAFRVAGGRSWLMTRCRLMKKTISCFQPPPCSTNFGPCSSPKPSSKWLPSSTSYPGPSFTLPPRALF